MDSTTFIAVVSVVFFFGAMMQRVSGMGVGLLAAPVLSLLMGPVQGILVVNLVAAANAAMSSWSVRRDIQWKKVALIGSVMVVGSLPAAWLITKVDGPILQVMVGALLILALLTVTIGNKFVPEVSGNAPAVASGVIGGFMNTIAGVAGPAITVYAIASRWPQVPYAASMQPLFLISGLVSFGLKSWIGTGGFGQVSGWLWPAAIFACLVGIIVGQKIAHRVNKSTARSLAITVALLGAISVFVRGLLAL